MGCSGNHTAPEKETGSTEKAVTQAVKDDETEGEGDPASTGKTLLLIPILLFCNLPVSQLS